MRTISHIAFLSILASLMPNFYKRPNPNKHLFLCLFDTELNSAAFQIQCDHEDASDKMGATN